MQVLAAAVAKVCFAFVASYQYFLMFIYLIINAAPPPATYLFAPPHIKYLCVPVIHIYIYIHIYIERERERERD